MEPDDRLKRGGRAGGAVAGLIATINIAHTLNPHIDIDIVARTHNEAETKLLKSENASKILSGEDDPERSVAVRPYGAVFRIELVDV